MAKNAASAPAPATPAAPAPSAMTTPAVSATAPPLPSGRADFTPTKVSALGKPPAATTGTAPIDPMAPKVREFKPQYNSDFGRSSASDSTDDAAAKGEPAETPGDAAADAGAAKTGEAAKPAEGAATATDQQGTPPVKRMSADERRAFLANLDGEESKRASESALRDARAKLEKLEKGTLAERLALAGFRTKEDAWAAMEAFIAGGGEVPTAGQQQTAAKPPENDEIKQLKDKIAALEQDRGTEKHTKLMNDIAQLTEWKDKPFLQRMGPAGLQRVAKVCNAIFEQQGRKGSVDVNRASAIVDDEYRDQFVRTWGEDAAGIVGGKREAAKTGDASAGKGSQTGRRPAVGARTPAAGGKAKMPLDREDRDRIIRAEMQAAGLADD